jgi:hypothetical protein
MTDEYRTRNIGHTVECNGWHEPEERCTTAEDDIPEEEHRRLCPDCQKQEADYRRAVAENPEATVDMPIDPHTTAEDDREHLNRLWAENDARLNPDEPAPDVDLDPDQPLCPACVGDRTWSDMICELYARTWDLKEAGEQLEAESETRLGMLERHEATERETVTELLNRVAALESKIG